MIELKRRDGVKIISEEGRVEEGEMISRGKHRGRRDDTWGILSKDGRR